MASRVNKSRFNHVDILSDDCSSDYEDMDDLSDREMNFACCPKEKKETVCQEEEEDLANSRGFKNFFRCYLEKNPGGKKCEAAGAAKEIYKNMKEREKCAYRNVACDKCPKEKCCNKKGCPGVKVCSQRDKAKKCIKCPCDKKRPCPPQYKTPNFCARGRQLDAALNARDAALQAVCGPSYCGECGGAYLGEAHDELACPCVEDEAILKKAMQASSRGFANFLKGFKSSYPYYSKCTALTKAKSLYAKLDDHHKQQLRGGARFSLTNTQTKRSIR